MRNALNDFLNFRINRCKCCKMRDLNQCHGCYFDDAFKIDINKFKECIGEYEKDLNEQVERLNHLKNKLL
jgi:hypothetical protein